MKTELKEEFYTGYTGNQLEDNLGEYVYLIPIRKNRFKIGKSKQFNKRMSQYAGCFNKKDFKYIKFGPVNDSKSVEEELIRFFDEKFISDLSEYYRGDSIEGAKTFIQFISLNYINNF